MAASRIATAFCVGFFAVAYCEQTARGAQADDAIRLDAPRGWRGEHIDLPPQFAPEMQFEGVEETRFAPGMFDAAAHDFLSYVIVFRLDGQPDLTEKTLQRELLAYYRGLATAVSGGAIKTDDFSLAVEREHAAQQSTDAANYVATLGWVEPFTTTLPQTLRIEIRVWDGANSRTWAFMSVSPNDTDDPIWETMRDARDSFVTGNATPTGATHRR